MRSRKCGERTFWPPTSKLTRFIAACSLWLRVRSRQSSHVTLNIQTSFSGIQSFESNLLSSLSATMRTAPSWPTRRSYWGTFSNSRSSCPRSPCSHPQKRSRFRRNCIRAGAPVPFLLFRRFRGNVPSHASWPPVREAAAFGSFCDLLRTSRCGRLLRNLNGRLLNTEWWRRRLLLSNAPASDVHSVQLKKWSQLRKNNGRKSTLEFLLTERSRNRRESFRQLRRLVVNPFTPKSDQSQISSAPGMLRCMQNFGSP